MKKTSTALLICIATTILTAEISNACGPGGCPLSRRLRQNTTTQYRSANWSSAQPSYAQRSYTQPSYTRPSVYKATYSPAPQRTENYTPMYQHVPAVAAPQNYGTGSYPVPANYSPAPKHAPSYQPAEKHYVSMPKVQTSYIEGPVYVAPPADKHKIVEVAPAPPKPKVVYQTVVKKQPAKKKPSIHLECNGEADEQCEFTLINPDGKEAQRTLASGEEQIYESSQPWKIMFRQAKDKEWVGFVVKPGHSYSLEKDEDDLWGLFEVG